MLALSKVVTLRIIEDRDDTEFSAEVGFRRRTLLITDDNGVLIIVVENQQRIRVGVSP